MVKTKLTAENYHSPEMRQKYFGSSQYKDFVGTLGMKGCEACALAKIKGEWEQELTTPLLVGSYVDAHFEGTLDVYKAQHPELFTKAGCLKADFCQAEEIITRIERDDFFMQFMAGEKQSIFTGELFGVPWKVKIDSLVREVCLTDLKVMRALRDSFWVKDFGYVSFVSYWGYDLQAAIYQEIARQNINKQLPFFIAAASKEKYTDIEIIGFKQQELDDVLSTIKPNVERIRQLKAGEVLPDRCEQCDFCKWTKVLDKPLHFSDLILKI